MLFVLMTSREHSLPRFDSFDHAVFIIDRLEQHMVARDHGIASLP